MKHFFMACGLAAGICVLSSCVKEQESPRLPTVPLSNYEVIDNFNYPDVRNARKVWQAMWGTEPVSIVNIDGTNAIKMTCNFVNSGSDRVGWDSPINLNLAYCQGLQFQFYCEDPSPVSAFRIYLRSGAGWYVAKFRQTKRTGWNHITIDKSEMTIEGEPAGWGKIDCIRIAASRGANVNTFFCLAHLGLLGSEARIAIVSGDSTAKNRPEEIRAVSDYTQTIAQHLNNLGIPYCVISDLDLSQSFLNDKKLVILPYNPDMPQSAARELKLFISGGGKLICFYVMPPEIAALVGIDEGKHIKQAYPGNFSSIRKFGEGLKGQAQIVSQKSWNIFRAKPIVGKSRIAAYWHNEKGDITGEPAIIVSGNCIQMTHVLAKDNPDEKQNLLLAMIGHFVPEAWQMAATRAVQQVSELGPYKDISQTVGSSENVLVKKMMEKGQSAAEKAKNLLVKGSNTDAFISAGEARSLMIEAYCMAQESKTGERRIFWCHNPTGVAGMSWDEAIKILAENGFTAIVPNMLWAGTAFYESKILPVARDVTEKGDQIKECLAACKKYGIECHIWKINWNTGWRVSEEFTRKMKEQNRIQVGFDRKPDPDWLCPSHPANQELEINSMLEVVKNYDVTGIHFDYIRYPNEDFCFCDGCRERFESAIGMRIKNWPLDVRTNSKLREQWLEFRRGNITKVVRMISEEARRIKPGIKISAAVFPDWRFARDTVGQDWKLWCEKGYMDFVCPMDYMSNNLEFEDSVKQQLIWTGKVPCYPGIGLSVWPDQDKISKLIEQVKITRQLGTGGFCVFDYNISTAHDIVPLCGSGITRRTMTAPSKGLR